MMTDGEGGQGEDEGEEMDEAIARVCEAVIAKRRYVSRALMKVDEAMSNG